MIRRKTKVSVLAVTALVKFAVRNVMRAAVSPARPAPGVDRLCAVHAAWVLASPNAHVVKVKERLRAPPAWIAKARDPCYVQTAVVKELEPDE
jgi:hypothetical protein